MRTRDGRDGHLQPISRKEKRKLATDIEILNYLPVRVNVSVFLLKMAYEIHEIAEVIKKTLTA